MRVLGVAHRYPPQRCAGAESHLHDLLRALANRGHRVEVCVTDQPGPAYELDGVVVRADDPVPLRWVPGADRIVTHLNNTFIATSLGNWNRVPTVVVHHNTFDQTKQALVRPDARVDLVAVNSQWMAADLADWFADRLETQPPTVVARPIADPAEYGTEPGDLVTLINLRRSSTVGPKNDGLSKGGELFRLLAERMPDTPFLGVTGAYGVQQTVSDLPNVGIIGPIPHGRMRDEVYARTRVLLVPSSYESWGRVASEAMCSGIPVIAHPTPGLVEQLGPAGIFVDRTDPDGWQQALHRLADPAEWAAASARAAARAGRLAADHDRHRWCDAVERIGDRQCVSS